MIRIVTGILLSRFVDGPDQRGEGPLRDDHFRARTEKGTTFTVTRPQLAQIDLLATPSEDVGDFWLTFVTFSQKRASQISFGNRYGSCSG
jgi:hypothetical protein